MTGSCLGVRFSTWLDRVPAAALLASCGFRGGDGLFSDGGTDPDAAMAKQGRLSARPKGSPRGQPNYGLHALGLGGRRHGLVYVPRSYRKDRPAPFALCPHPSRRQRQRRKGHRSFVEEGRGGGPGVACTRISGQDLGRGAGAVSGPTSPSSIDPLSMCSSAMPSIRATLRFRLLGRRLLRPFHGDHQRRPLQSLHRPLAGVFGAGRTAGPWAATDRRAAA